MKKVLTVMPVAAALFLLLGAAGCATRTVYDSLRFHQEMDCQKLQGADRDACMQRSGMSYDEYQRHLKEQDRKE